MASPSLAENRAIILMGFENDRNVEVSTDVKSLGLNLLRASPSDFILVGIPDVQQARYGDYLHNLPAFMYSCIKKVKTSNIHAGFPIRFEDIPTLLPFRPIPLTLAWVSGHIPEETVEQIRNSMIVTEGVSGGKPAIVYTPTNWKDYDKIKGYNANIRAAAPLEHINIGAMIAARGVMAILTALTVTHSYPAFVDKDHEHAIRGAMEEGDDDVDMIEDTSRPTWPGAPYGNVSLQIAETKSLIIDMAKSPIQPDGITYVDISQNLDGLPHGDGLWFPYFDALSQYDTKTVPEFFDRFLVKSLGDELEACITGNRKVRSEWGMIGKTQSGKAITHYVKILEVGLEAQARVLPLFRTGNYVGAVMLGAGYTIDANRKSYRPVSEDDLRSAIKTSNLHNLALEKIGNLVGNDQTKVKVLGCKSMLELRKVLLEGWTSAGSRDELLGLAACLDFGERHWNISLNSIRNAANAIKDPNFSLLVADAPKFPIHHSKLLTTETLDVIWSCFGSYAPSFRIPGGKQFDLREEMSITEYNKKTGKDVIKKFTRISVRQKVLDQAINDLKLCRESKSILNPLVAPKVRISQQNMDKVFSGDDGKDLLAVLRLLCDAAVNTSNKRVAGGSGEEPAAKKAKSVFDGDGW